MVFPVEAGVVFSSGSMRNDGDMRNACSVALATSSAVGSEGGWPIARKPAPAAAVSGRRNALRPKLLMVAIRQPDAAGSQVMNFAFCVGLAMTVVAIALPTSL